MTKVHVRGIFINGSVTGVTFNGVMYAVTLFLLLLLRCSLDYRLLTRSYFLLVRPYPNCRIFSYIPGTANTPVLEGFQGCFTVYPEADNVVAFELWWMGR